MSLSYTFGALTVWQAGWLDTNFAEVGACTTIPCTITGTNTLTLAALTNTPAPSSYANYQRWSGVAAADNTGAVSANAGPGLLPVYKDTSSGPVALVGGEIQAGNYVVLVYDEALNSGAGGLHLEISPSTASGTITAVNAGSGIAGGGASGAVSVALASITDQRVLANISGGSAAPIQNTMTAILDAVFSNTQGAVLYRGATVWSALAPGTQGQYLYTPGAGGNPSWRGGLATGIAAAGSTQGTATAAPAEFNQIATVGSGTGIILSAPPGTPQWFWNDGANTLNIYPPVGSQIDSAGTNNPVTIAAGSKAGYVSVSATQARTI